VRALLIAEAPSTRALIQTIRSRKLTYVSRHKMKRCATALALVRRANVPGCFVEAGVALGGTAVLIAKLRPVGRPVKLYDVFGMIPPPGPNDAEDARSRYEVICGGRSDGIGGEEYYGYRTDLLDQVIEHLRGFGLDPVRDNIELLPGSFEDRMHPSEPVAFAHIDCDWYDSVMTCIDRLFPQLSPGGIMVFDDYMSYSGCKKAVDGFLAVRTDIEILFAERSIGIRKMQR
jgi:asparagine synthase (glutamine-hydrolysing)